VVVEDGLRAASRLFLVSEELALVVLVYRALRAVWVWPGLVEALVEVRSFALV